MTFKTRFLEAGMSDAGRSGLRSQQEVELALGQGREVWHSFDATGAVPFYPAPGGSLFRFFVLPSPEDGLTPEIDRDISATAAPKYQIHACANLRRYRPSR
ncbi:hypothetical protein ELG83_34200 (plasmid) [Rhizobium leguminosarum]|nr:hypothetical protein [Rhizobium leguminosarum]WSH10488.1 hypothetical protein U8P72_25385 [Rhizobium johnstonii]MBY5378961.1 hypothetical protein [Rhizobium leguminosarum]TBF23784.1 hypothetical protein ELG88_34210 [Rhizobium leguminosarum]TBF44762.1 hypothetical protein ELG91_33180 [Rhizobium leguminosarum]TBF45629.1 hypothetical protein ELG90_34215 [Rhizobium leguminosarum]